MRAWDFPFHGRGWVGEDVASHTHLQLYLLWVFMYILLEVLLWLLSLKELSC